MEKKKIFVIDDDPLILNLLEEVLKNNGFIVHTMDTGEGVFEKVLTEKFDLIILDLLLPGKSGIAILDELKNDERTKDIPVIVVSAVGKNKFFFEKGIIDFLEKPIDLDQFVGRVNSALMDFKEIDLEKIKEEIGDGEDSIAVIEDDPNILNLLKDFLESHNFKVYTASNGKEGLKLINREKPKVIILDLQMPEIDGFKVLSLLKDNIKKENLKIIVLTSLTDEGIKKLCLEMGAKYFIRKPFDINVLLGVVNSLLK